MLTLGWGIAICFGVCYPVINIIKLIIKNMKTKIKFMLVALMATVIFHLVSVLLLTMPVSLWRIMVRKVKKILRLYPEKFPHGNGGTELFQVPLFEQRGGFQKSVTLKAADNTEFNATPLYSYRVIKDKAIDVVFDNKHIGNGDGFMRSLEDNILEPRIYDLIKEESRKYKTDTLMADGGSLAFEKKLEDIVRAEFKDRGLDLKSFSAQLEFSDRVREKIDNRNEVNTNISVIDQKIEEQKKQNELERLKTEQALITSKGLTKEILYKQFIDKWDGKTPLYGVIPEFLKMTN